MFFRRQTPHTPVFAERLDRLRQLGFQVEVQPGGSVRVSRQGCAAEVVDAPDGSARVTKAGLLMGGEIGALVDLGYQKVWQSPSGRREPALAAHLAVLHAFEEDLRDGLGLTSLYNQGLGTTNDLHLYDRVKDRDRGVPQRPWER